MFTFFLSCHAQNGSNNGAGIIPSNMTNSTTIGPTPQQAPPPAHRFVYVFLRTKSAVCLFVSIVIINCIFFYFFSCPTPPKKVHKFTETSKFKDSATETETTITGVNIIHFAANRKYLSVVF